MNTQTRSFDRLAEKFWTNKSRCQPHFLQQKNTEIETQLAKGVHPQSLGAKKIRCLPNLYRMRMSYSYRMLIGLDDNHWTSLGLYSRQSFTTLLNRRRR